MGLPQVYDDVLEADHVRALEEAIGWSVDHALDELGVVEEAELSGEDLDWNTLPLMGRLPPRYQHRYTPQMLRPFVVCLVTVTGKMADPDRVGSGMCSCVGEELAAHLVANAAGWLLAADRQDRGASVADVDFSPLESLWFEDTDVEWLYRPELDGIEADEEVEAELGVAHLVPERWFEPFAGHVVHPYVTPTGAEGEPARERDTSSRGNNE